MVHFWILLAVLWIGMGYLIWTRCGKNWWGVVFGILSVLALCPIFVPYGLVGRVLGGIPLWFWSWLGVHAVFAFLLLLYFRGYSTSDGQVEQVIADLRNNQGGE